MPLDPRAIESLLAFWTSAGVDVLYGDAPLNRTVAAPPPAPVSGRQSPNAKAPAPPPARPTTPNREPSAAVPEAEASAAAVAAALVAARLAATAAQDLTALASAIAAFDGCALKAAARQAVFSRGPSNAPVMIIGEAPGAEEDAQGLPFVGRAGQLLDRMLAAAGLTDRVFITNTVFWRPPGNRTPTAAEQAVCAPFLERAITLVKPGLLVLVGGASAKAMLKKTEGILSLRGRWFEWRSEDESLEIPALPTLHPSFLLRQPAAKRKSWEDLLILTERLGRPPRPT
jgi:DNA polymerase